MAVDRSGCTELLTKVHYDSVLRKYRGIVAHLERFPLYISMKRDLLHAKCRGWKEKGERY